MEGFMGSGSLNYCSWNAFGFRSSSAESEDIAVVILETASIIRSLVGTGDERAASDGLQQGDINVFLPRLGFLTQSSCDAPRQGRAGDRLRFLLDASQVVAPTKALGVELVDVFRAGRTHRKPALSGDDLQAADRRAVPWRRRQHSLDWMTGKLGGADIPRRKVEKSGFFFHGGGRVDTRVNRCPQLTS